MLFLLPLALLCVCLPGAHVARRGEFFDSLDRDYTGAVKGIFAVLIVFSHMLGYIGPVTAADRAFSLVISGFGQFTVVMFFFYSGAGVAISQAKNRDYRRTFFTHRILKTMVHFAIAVALYIPLAYALGRQYSPARIALAFIGWTSIGNSNWFVFAILALYLATLIAFLVFPDRPILSAAAVTVLCVGYIILMRIYKESFWYNTVLCYPLGMLAATVRPGGKRYALRLMAALAVTALPLVLYLFLPGADFQLFYTVTNCGFAYLCYLIGMKIKVGNRVLGWLGALSFGIYILQRLPMSLIAHYVPDPPPIVFALASLAAAVLIAVPFTGLTKLIDRVLFSRRPARR